MATVRVDGAAEVTLTAGDSVLPVSQAVHRPGGRPDLLAGEPGAPDPRCWLGQGVVPGGGLAVTIVPGPGRPGPSGVAAAEAPGPVTWPPAGPDAADTTARAAPRAATDGRPPAVVAGTAAATVLPAAASPADDAGHVSRPVLVDGVVCGSDHFNGPDARACRQCGARPGPAARSLVRRPRPPLGVLVLR